jgi:hypothetical protein
MDLAGAADDFFVNMSLQTTMGLSQGRESVLHFCEAVQKEFRQMTSFYRRESGEYVLEGDRDAGAYQWLEIDKRRMSAGHFNPPELADAYRLHRWLLDRSLYFLGTSPLDVECLDLLFGFNLDFRGNRDAVTAEALLGGSPLWALVGEATGACIECEPSLVIALDEPCHLQARLSVETRCSSYQVRTGQYDDEPISVYFTVRSYPPPGELFDTDGAFQRQSALCEDLVRRVVLPNVIQPIAAAIATH